VPLTEASLRDIFLRAVRGEEDVLVSGAAGAQALALAFRVADAIQASPLATTRP